MASHTRHLQERLSGMSLSRSGSRGAAPDLHGHLLVGVVSARDLSAGETSIVGLLSRLVTDASDTFCEVSVGPRSLLKTATCHNGGREPVWDERGLVDVCDRVDVLHVRVYAAAGVNLGRISKARTLGVCEVSVEEIVRDRIVRREFALNSKHRRSDAGFVTLEFEFVSVSEILRASAGSYTVPNSYFPMRTGCMLTLFQDAHVPRGCGLPTPVDVAGVPYVQRSAWTEMYHAILGAQKVVYVSGWSVVTSLRLVREPVEGMTLGELLVKKADEGVTVSVLIWDEVASVSLAGGIIQSAGIMATQDEETYAYFKNTRVNCEKVSRMDDGSNGLFGNLQTGGLWSHHIKCVVADREFPLDRGRRRLIAYVGGLDLTFGRFDTPAHDLFRTLSTLHKDDFHQGCVLGSTMLTGPREPWHDVHCCVEGGIAWDAARTFEDRWRRQAPKTAGAAIRPMPPEEFASGDEERHVLLTNPEHWNAQFFRSMDERSVVYDFPPAGVSEMSLGTKKGRAVEAGIVRAYVHYIRKAERMIWIENQYFMGGSAEWVKVGATAVCFLGIPVSFLANSLLRPISPSF
jgi:C2 domain